ncbi:TIGR02678 family protein [Micromonospora craniellae]|uniref:TIGR02678 family protein n=1 Tax=Micromonospora craniellae TaxID=2294034 RepID=A0A372FT96_9ACTN|nr:TIGR02678 family protein [Micromonospora craniellae]QOC93946.1 TIGR02678 family protein [Micromonospora craniellae]RFS44012.1 TIGR02678 family protein [Micromonospora craniellae]
MTAESNAPRPAVHRFAVDVPELELADYQRAVRLVLRHPLITATWPDERALPRVRRFSAALRRDLAEAFGYRLELHGATARLVRAKDRLDGTQPAVSRTGRPFDRQRYAYLSLCLAVLGRAGIQITLSELADSVAADANRITGLGLDPDHGSDRRSFVDAVGWLEERGVLRLADGSSAAWASDPGAGEALYDVARDVVFALFRPTRVVQHVDSVSALLDRAMSSSGNAERRQAAQAARRAVVESPVVYHADVEPAVANHLRGSALAADLARLTGLRVERRAEGVLLVDTAGFTAERFPGTGSVAQAAVLLAAEMADRVADPDGRRVKRLAPPDGHAQQQALVGHIDASLPTATLVRLDDADPDKDWTVEGESGPDEADGTGRLPFITDSFLRSAVGEILQRYGTAFGAQWHADPDRLRAEAVALLERFGAVTAVPGGVLVRPLVGRYRHTVATVKPRATTETLF